MERTFVMIKSDAIKRGLVAEIIKRIEQTGLKIVAMKMMKPTAEFVKKLYPSSEEWFKSLGEKTKKSYSEQGFDIKETFKTINSLEIGKIVKGWLIKYIASGPSIGIVVEGNRAISIIRKLCGYTYPDEALAGTIRGDLGTDSSYAANSTFRAVQNLVHASGDKKEVENEINLWFEEEEIINYHGEEK